MFLADQNEIEIVNGLFMGKITIFFSPITRLY